MEVDLATRPLILVKVICFHHTVFRAKIVALWRVIKLLMRVPKPSEHGSSDTLLFAVDQHGEVNACSISLTIRRYRYKSSFKPADCHA
jgi:hypothetical protein